MGLFETKQDKLIRELRETYEDYNQKVFRATEGLFFLTPEDPDYSELREQVSENMGSRDVCMLIEAVLLYHNDFTKAAKGLESDIKPNVNALSDDEIKKGIKDMWAAIALLSGKDIGYGFDCIYYDRFNKKELICYFQGMQYKLKWAMEILKDK